MILVNDNNFKSEVLDFSGVVVVDFFATWCGPCRMISPFLESIEKEINNIKIVKVDIDQSPDIASEYDVMSVPTLILFKNGKKISTSVGASSKARLVDWINSRDC